MVYALVAKGTDLTHFATLGRTIPRAVARALIERDRVCIVLSCSVRDNLEVHHRDPVNNQGETSTKNCGRACKWHHYLCTHHGWEVGGSAESGWTFDPPTGRAPPDDRSPPDELPLAG